MSTITLPPGTLGQFQDAFAHALWQPTPAPGDHPSAEPPPPAWLQAITCQPGFSVYRNTVLKGCVDALQDNYPTVCELVGTEWLRAAATVFATQHPPKDGLLMGYGDGFADFLADFPPAAQLPYLSAVAAWDRRWTECHLAADALLLDAAWLGAQAPEALENLVLTPHPAARWSQSHEHPAFTIWQRQRAQQSLEHDLPWHGDAGLLTRPEATVQWTALSPSGCALLDACALGLPFAQAAQAALEARQSFNPEDAQLADPADLSHLIAQLLHAGAFQAATVAAPPY